MKKLVVYYSLDGNTRFIARKLAEKFQADLLELKPEKEIPKKEPFKHLWGGKQVIMSESPKLEDHGIQPDEYDLLLIGTPVWAFTFAPPIRSFLKEHQIKNKKVVVFCTHQGMPGRIFANFKKALKRNDVLAEIDFKNVLGDQEGNLRKLNDFVVESKIKTTEQ